MKTFASCQGSWMARAQQMEREELAQGVTRPAGAGVPSGLLQKHEWLMSPELLGDACEALERFERVRHIWGADDHAAAERILAKGDHQPGTVAVPKGVAVVPVEGVLLPKAPAWARAIGIGSTATITAQVNAAATDPRCRGLLLLIDSPGGAVPGIHEAAEAVRLANTLKPCVAVAEFTAASAAYWIASQAREIVAPPSALLGSIGVITTRVDVTQALAQDGIKIHVTALPATKAEGHPATTMSEDERTAIEARVRSLFDMFATAVARGRGVSVADVEQKFGGGRAYYGREAVRRGLADRLGTLDEVLRRTGPLSTWSPVAKEQAEMRARMASLVAPRTLMSSGETGDLARYTARLRAIAAQVAR